MLQPNIMTKAWAEQGAKTTPIPETTTVLGKASLSQGFPTETSLPLANGGVPPRREDFNGAFYMLSAFAMFQQTGGQFTWSNQLNYDPPCIVYYNGDLWWCLRKNGPSESYTSAPQPPATNSSYWKKFKDYISPYSPLDAYPVGSYYISSNATNPANLAGFAGSTWVQIKDCTIMAKGDKITGNVNSLGGNNGSNGTLFGQFKMTNAHMPSHNHSCTTAGSHTHARGTLNITGSIVNSSSDTERLTYADHITSKGALKVTNLMKTNGFSEGSGEGSAYNGIAFNAADGWSGSLASNGAHTHNIGNTGNGQAFSIMPPYIVAYVWRRTA